MLLSIPRVGHWATHQYTRRAVSRDIKKTDGFVGWERLLEIASEFKDAKYNRTLALYAAAFLTGGRIGAVLSLMRDNFNFKDGEIIVRGMPLLKRYEKVSGWTQYVDEKPKNKLARLFEWDEARKQYGRRRFETKILHEVRPTFSFPMDEPLALLLRDWVEASEDLLFPGNRGKSLSYQRVYQLFTKVELDREKLGSLYPHWIRAQRASCLISFYGWKTEEMMEWLGWEEISTARMYGKFGVRRLSMRMGGVKYPDAALKIQESL